MKQTIVAFCFFMSTLLSTYGQWYERQYNVTNINQLSKAQLELSIADAKNNILTASLVGGVGGIGWLILNMAHEAVLTSYVCAGVFVGGAIVSLAYLQRIYKIRSTIKRSFPASTSLNISPALILNKYTGSYSPGISIFCSF